MSELATLRAKTPAELKAFDPEAGAIRIDAAAAAEVKARRKKDNEALLKAMQIKIQGIADFVVWWDNVARKDKGAAEQRDTRSGKAFDSLDEYGLTPNVVSRWRRKVCEKRDGEQQVSTARMEAWISERTAKLVEQFDGEAAAEIGGIALSTGVEEWYTPSNYVEAARDVMGSIDVDPASCEKANATVRAATFYTKEDNGLEQPWHGNVFINPPYTAPLVRSFADRLAKDYSAGDINAGIFLVHNATDSDWWQKLASVADAVCFTDGRINFVRGATMTVEPGSSIRGQSILYLGPDKARFREVFSQFGLCMEPCK